jgi:hypothetical protein
MVCPVAVEIFSVDFALNYSNDLFLRRGKQLFGKCGEKSKKHLKKSTPDTDAKNEEITACMFCDELFSRSKPGEELVKCVLLLRKNVTFNFTVAFVIQFMLCSWM